MPDIRDKVWEVLAETANATPRERVDAFVRLINEEKSKSYGIGFHDGTRKTRPFLGR